MAWSAIYHRMPWVMMSYGPRYATDHDGQRDYAYHGPGTVAGYGKPLARYVSRGVSVMFKRCQKRLGSATVH